MKIRIEKAYKIEQCEHLEELKEVIKGFFTTACTPMCEIPIEKQDDMIKELAIQNKEIANTLRRLLNVENLLLFDLIYNDIIVYLFEKSELIKLDSMYDFKEDEEGYYIEII